MKGRRAAVDAAPDASPSRSELRRKRELPAEDPDAAEEQPTPTRRRRASKKARENEIAPGEVEDAAASLENGNGTQQANGLSEELAGEEVPQTPSKRKRGRPRKTPTKVEPGGGGGATPSRSTERKTLATPVKTDGANGPETPSRRNIADRSARRKSARALIDRVVAGTTSDDDEAGEEGLVREIYESSENEADEDEAERQELEEEAEEVDDELGEPASEAATPSKTRRGRKKKVVTRKKSPSPPRDLPPHELYFWQNKPGSAKTSNNTLSSMDLLTHEEYFTVLREYKNPHVEDIEFLQSLHAQSFPQWRFELLEGFSICLYGYGSKRHLLHRFAADLYAKSEDHKADKIVIVNGYVRTTSIREILSAIGSAVDSSYKLPSGNPVAMVQNLSSLIFSAETSLTVILNSVDAPPMRRAGTQAVLSQLASHPAVRLICSADTPDFPLLWDSGLRSAFNFAFHDCTTFAPFGPELDAVDDVHELLGRRARRVGGKDGVAFVLRSLPENAKNLFRLLVGEVLVAMEEEGEDGVGAGAEGPGVEYRMLYNKAVEEFICSSEMAFRTLLKEFHDHQMITSRKDILGTELLSVPFRKDELEAILEDLMS